MARVQCLGCLGRGEYPDVACCKMKDVKESGCGMGVTTTGHKSLRKSFAVIDSDREK